jgi:hypothetical protein
MLEKIESGSFRSQNTLQRTRQISEDRSRSDRTTIRHLRLEAHAGVHCFNHQVQAGQTGNDSRLPGDKGRSSLSFRGDRGLGCQIPQRTKILG